MVKIHKTMEKLKVGDIVKIKKVTPILQRYYNIGDECEIKGISRSIGQLLYIYTEDKSDAWWFDYDDVEKIEEQASFESQSKKIKQALRKICLSGLVIKSEKIISKVKQDIGTDYVFGDTILRALRQLRQDGEVDYAADKQTREYTFK